MIKSGQLLNSRTLNAAFMSKTEMNSILGSILTTQTITGGALISTGTLSVTGTSALTGNVGIGASQDATSKLYIKSADNTAGNNIIQILSNNLNQGIGVGYDEIRKIGSTTNSNLIVNAKGTGHIYLQSTATGNIGIGLASASTPVAKLDVRGSASIGDGSVYGSSRLVVTSDNSSQLVLIRKDGSSRPVSSIMAGSTATHISTGAYMTNGVWTHVSPSSTSNMITLEPGNGALWYASSNNSASWNVSNGTKLWSDTAILQRPIQVTDTTSSYFMGKLGVGNNNPQYALDITGDIRATGVIYGDLAKPPIFTPAYSTKTINADTNTVAHGLTVFDKSRDALMVFENSAYINNTDDYTISADGASIIKVAGVWKAGTIFNFLRFGLGMPTEEDISFMAANLIPSSFTATVANTTNIPIGNPNFSPSLDSLLVFYNNELLYEGDNYTLNGDNQSISLVGFSITTGEKILFHIWKRTKVSSPQSAVLKAIDDANIAVNSINASVAAANAVANNFNTAEANRVSAENTRVSAETGRVSAETTRVSNENARIASEATRASQEGTRQTQETTRQSQETTRQNNETARKVWENYSAAKAYVVGNKVAYNGASYYCLANCTGVTPGTDASKWLLIAAAGSITAIANLNLGLGGNGDVSIIVNNADANKPAIKYDDTQNVWLYSNDGVTFKKIGSGGFDESGNNLYRLTGNIGFGYTDPTERLTVDGGISLKKKFKMEYNSTENSLDFIYTG